MILLYYYLDIVIICVNFWYNCILENRCVKFSMASKSIIYSWYYLCSCNCSALNSSGDGGSSNRSCKCRIDSIIAAIVSLAPYPKWPKSPRRN